MATSTSRRCSRVFEVNGEALQDKTSSLANHARFELDIHDNLLDSDCSIPLRFDVRGIARHLHFGAKSTLLEGLAGSNTRLRTCYADSSFVWVYQLLPLRACLEFELDSMNTLGKVQHLESVAGAK